MGESQTAQPSAWWHLLKDQGVATVMQWFGAASPQFERLFAGRDMSWILAWFPTAMAGKKLTTTLFKVLYEFQHAFRHNSFEQGFGINDLAARERILGDYQALLDSVPEDVTWLHVLQRIDAMYMSWLDDEQSRKSMMDILLRAESHADAFLAQMVDLLFAPQSPAELRVMTQFFERAQVFLERILEEIMLSGMSTRETSPDSSISTVETYGEEE